MVTIKPKDISVKFTDTFFFDTNVWILLFGTIADYEKRDQRAYSNLLSTLISRDSAIYINSMVVSEFANVLLRLDFHTWASSIDDAISKSNYKRDFVGTQEYKSSVENVKFLINKILSIPIVDKISDGYNSIDNDKVNENFGIADYNDAYLAETARLNGYSIVTNDADFIKMNSDIRVITTKVLGLF